MLIKAGKQYKYRDIDPITSTTESIPPFSKMRDYFIMVHGPLISNTIDSTINSAKVNPELS